MGRELLLRNPDGGGAEEMIDDADVVGEEQAEAKTQQARAGDKTLM